MVIPSFVHSICPYTFIVRNPHYLTSVMINIRTAMIKVPCACRLTIMFILVLLLYVRQKIIFPFILMLQEQLTLYGKSSDQLSNCRVLRDIDCSRKDTAMSTHEIQ